MLGLVCLVVLELVHDQIGVEMNSETEWLFRYLHLVWAYFVLVFKLFEECVGTIEKMSAETFF